MSYRITETCNGCGACLRLCPAGAIAGEKKQLHVIDGALCIECGVCGRICPQDAVKDAAGVTCVMMKRSEWLRPELDPEACTACGICIDACPVGCLAMMEKTGDRGRDPEPSLIYERACIGCGFCSLECPTDALSMAGPVRASA